VGGEVPPSGAGLLSAFGEIQQIERAQLRPLDVARMGVQDYDITHYQPLLFCGESFGEVEDVVGTFFETATDDTIAALLKPAGV
jgi:phenylalanine-4-hydroxylase